MIDGSVVFVFGYPNGVYNLIFVNSWFSSVGTFGGNGNGLHIVSAQGISVDSSQFYSNSYSGLRVGQAARDTTLSNSILSGNSNGYGNGGANNAKYSAITIDPAGQNFSLMNNRAGRTSVYANTQKSGVSVGAGADHFRIIGNDLEDNMVAGLQNQATSTNSVVALNLPVQQP